ncbi:DUF192 domain-containing protein [Chitinophaga rhizophila]|uniref:DUF192 domain-containing protein n=1 Tax=Chitinophaga rhizophila TaxID=2866212 RepID=A0ABS7GJC0_9BACT|nr:DUF192 domain-containing protein [Chitinophaga rhizophila]MBW8687315.1 DUF192 domain-containing protein [Chitinophaga rhizophila]
MAVSRWFIFNAGLILYVTGCHTKNSQPAANSNSGSDGNTISATADSGPPFKKEGVLYFLSKVNNDTIRQIDIEFADTDEERANGLMNRRSMQDSQGMLFIFPAAEEQSFWMKNTYISLDIIYLNEQKEIISVQKYTTPLSEESLPSFKKAQYALEVNAGFCDKYHVAYGDKIAYTKRED